MMPNDRGITDVPGYDAEELIGVELTFIGYNGNRTEMEMLVPKKRLQFGTSRTGNGHYNNRIQVTLHMTNGDRAGEIVL